MDKPSLLIVDDEEGPRQSLRIVFKNDYEVFVAASGSEALAIAAAHRVHVVVCDILMHGMSGVDVLRELKRLNPKIEVIMLTAYETLETARQALRYGASDYLNKPFDILTMRAAVSKAVKRYQATEQFDQTNRQLQELYREVYEQRQKEGIERTRGDIYASVLHDINSPLTVISGFIDLINGSMQGSATVEGEQLKTLKGDLQHLTSEVARCFEISRRYLRFLNQGGSEDMSSNVRQILCDLADLLRKHPSAQGHRLEVQQLDKDLVSAINGTDLLQILLNLTINALQSTDSPHTVRVSCEVQKKGLPADKTVTSVNQRFVACDNFTAGRELIALSIADTGPGIPAAILGRMFEDRFTTKSPDRGTGLGLSIVKRLVSNASGAIRVTTEIGAGATFTVYLPSA